MRERRWESCKKTGFEGVLSLGRRLYQIGLKPAAPSKEIIAYIEEWTVQDPSEASRLGPWHVEDLTLIHAREDWKGDFFLLAGAYHDVYRRRRAPGTYCSVSHPWKIREPLRWHDPAASLWVGFRDLNAFVRVRLNTTEVIAPGETRGSDRRELWLQERRTAFESAVRGLELPIEMTVEKEKLILRTAEEDAVLLCSWPDAFGPCQFEYNVPDAFELLVPAARLASTYGGEPASLRAYMTGFSEKVLREFSRIEPGARLALRGSLHLRLEELPELLQRLRPDGRICATLCEFQTRQHFPDMNDAWVIIGVVGTQEGYSIEARLSLAPLPDLATGGWLESLLGRPMAYAPLPPFP